MSHWGYVIEQIVQGDDRTREAQRHHRQRRHRRRHYRQRHFWQRHYWQRRSATPPGVSPATALPTWWHPWRRRAEQQALRLVPTAGPAPRGPAPAGQG